MFSGRFLEVAIPAGHLHGSGSEGRANTKFEASRQRFRSLVEHLRDSCAQIRADFFWDVYAGAEITDIDERFTGFYNLNAVESGDGFRRAEFHVVIRLADFKNSTVASQAVIPECLCRESTSI